MKRNYPILFVIIGCLFLISSVSALNWTSASGCWTAQDTKYNYVMWNATGTNTWTVPSGVSSVSYLVVAGGGGGGNGVYGANDGGGGGAGGLLQGDAFGVSNIITVVVGSYGVKNTKGSNSSFSTLVANGGAAGGSASAGGSGGSGGGGASTTNWAGGSATPTGQGNDGGAGTAAGNYPGGGGGGSNQKGNINGLGRGGDGLLLNITGTPTYYAGGGGGGQGSSSLAGGLGGGGAGAISSGSVAVKGTDGLGGGGGGGGSGSGADNQGASGGSGIIIIRWEQITPVALFNIQLIDTSINSPTSWQWNYTNLTGSNIPVTFSTSQHPFLSFATTGNYLITLIASNGGGSNTTTKNIGINLTNVQVYFWERTA
jgi:hypothetical protein